LFDKRSSSICGEPSIHSSPDIEKFVISVIIPFPVSLRVIYTFEGGKRSSGAMGKAPEWAREEGGGDGVTAADVRAIAASPQLLRTPVTELFRIKHPVLLAGMNVASGAHTHARLNPALLVEA
jgi:hypothetical protein